MAQVVFDIGGTNMRLAVVENGNLSHIKKMSTPEEPSAAMEAIEAYLSEVDVNPESIAGGVPGTVRDGKLIRLGNLPKWDGFDLADELQKVVNDSVQVLNDADLEGLGEARVGAGEGKRIVAYITVGTGVGGTHVIDGESVLHAEGIEPGQQIIDFESGRTLENLVGGAALFAETGKQPEERSREFMKERTKVLAVGLYNTIRLWSPDILVLNGGLINDEDGFVFSDIETELKELIAHRHMPILARAKFGDEAGLYGAMTLL